MTFTTKDGVTRCDRCRRVIDPPATWREKARHECARRVEK